MHRNIKPGALVKIRLSFSQTTEQLIYVDKIGLVVKKNDDARYGFYQVLFGDNKLVNFHYFDLELVQE